MRADGHSSPNRLRVILQLVIAIAGVAAIVASTGGGSGPSCAIIIPGPSCDFGPGTQPPAPPPPAQAAVALTPARQVTQVGMPASFTAQATNLSNPTYSWCRAPSTGGTCAPLAGEHGPTYTIPAVGMSDDGVQFRVTASGTQGTATSGFGTLHVSPMPAVVFEDGEFLGSEWVVSSVAFPPDSAPTFNTSRMTAGGNPGAFLSETYNIPATIGRTLVFHSRTSANYYPTSQGSIYLVEFSLQCKTSTPLTWVTFMPMFEQGERRFAPDNPSVFGGGHYCSGAAWHDVQWGPISQFFLASGPACGQGESCPDLSASAAPLRFGFMIVARSLAPGAAQTITYDYDNWKVTVWRR